MTHAYIKVYYFLPKVGMISQGKTIVDRKIKIKIIINHYHY